MFIPCSEKCPYNSEGECKKDNCFCETGYLISCKDSCPFNVIGLPQALADRKRFESDKAVSVLSVF